MSVGNNNETNYVDIQTATTTSRILQLATTTKRRRAREHDSTVSTTNKRMRRCSRRNLAVTRLTNTHSWLPKTGRVWWPPTKDRIRTDFSAMLWPATIMNAYILRGESSALKKGEIITNYDEQCRIISLATETIYCNDSKSQLLCPVCLDYNDTDIKVLVKYDDESTDLIPLDFLQPFEEPNQKSNKDSLGGLLPGELCFISNGSETDPAEWFGIVIGKNDKGNYRVSYPFHTSPNELVKAEFVRRAIWFHPSVQQWMFFRPKQFWLPGTIFSLDQLLFTRSSGCFGYYLSHIGTILDVDLSNGSALATFLPPPNIATFSDGSRATVKSKPRTRLSLAFNQTSSAKPKLSATVCSKSCHCAPLFCQSSVCHLEEIEGPISPLSLYSFQDGKHSVQHKGLTLERCNTDCLRHPFRIPLQSLIISEAGLLYSKDPICSKFSNNITGIPKLLVDATTLEDLRELNRFLVDENGLLLTLRKEILGEKQTPVTKKEVEDCLRHIRPISVCCSAALIGRAVFFDSNDPLHLISNQLFQSNEECGQINCKPQSDDRHLETISNCDIDSSLDFSKMSFSDPFSVSSITLTRPNTSLKVVRPICEDSCTKLLSSPSVASELQFESSKHLRQVSATKTSILKSPVKQKSIRSPDKCPTISSNVGSILIPDTIHTAINQSSSILHPIIPFPFGIPSIPRSPTKIPTQAPSIEPLPMSTYQTLHPMPQLCTPTFDKLAPLIPSGDVISINGHPKVVTQAVESNIKKKKAKRFPFSETGDSKTSDNSEFLTTEGKNRLMSLCKMLNQKQQETSLSPLIQPLTHYDIHNIPFSPLSGLVQDKTVEATALAANNRQIRDTSLNDDSKPYNADTNKNSTPSTTSTDRTLFMISNKSTSPVVNETNGYNSASVLQSPVAETSCAQASEALSTGLSSTTYESTIQLSDPTELPVFQTTEGQHPIHRTTVVPPPLKIQPIITAISAPPRIAVPQTMLESPMSFPPQPIIVHPVGPEGKPSPLHHSKSDPFPVTQVSQSFLIALKQSQNFLTRTDSEVQRLWKFDPLIQQQCTNMNGKSSLFEDSSFAKSSTATEKSLLMSSELRTHAELSVQILNQLIHNVLQSYNPDAQIQEIQEFLSPPETMDVSTILKEINGRMRNVENKDITSYSTASSTLPASLPHLRSQNQNEQVDSFTEFRLERPHYLSQELPNLSSQLMTVAELLAKEIAPDTLKSTRPLPFKAKSQSCFNDPHDSLLFSSMDCRNAVLVGDVIRLLEQIILPSCCPTKEQTVGYLASEATALPKITNSYKATERFLEPLSNNFPKLQATDIPLIARVLTNISDRQISSASSQVTNGDLDLTSTETLPSKTFIQDADSVISSDKSCTHQNLNETNMSLPYENTSTRFPFPVASSSSSPKLSIHRLIIPESFVSLKSTKNDASGDMVSKINKLNKGSASLTSQKSFPSVVSTDTMTTDVNHQKTGNNNQQRSNATNDKARNPKNRKTKNRMRQPFRKSRSRRQSESRHDLRQPSSISLDSRRLVNPEEVLPSSPSIPSCEFEHWRNTFPDFLPASFNLSQSIQLQSPHSAMIFPQPPQTSSFLGTPMGAQNNVPLPAWLSDHMLQKRPKLGRPPLSEVDAHQRLLDSERELLNATVFTGSPSQLHSNVNPIRPPHLTPSSRLQMHNLP